MSRCHKGYACHPHENRLRNVWNLQNSKVTTLAALCTGTAIGTLHERLWTAANSRERLRTVAQCLSNTPSTPKPAEPKKMLHRNNAHQWALLSKKWAWHTGETRFSAVKNLQKKVFQNWAVSRFTTEAAHFHRSISVDAENKPFFLRRCVSRLQLPSFASWHWGWYTSIANTWRRAVNVALRWQTVGNVSL